MNLNLILNEVYLQYLKRQNIGEVNSTRKNEITGTALKSEINSNIVMFTGFDYPTRDWPWGIRRG